MAQMTDLATRTSSSENTTVTITPAVGENFEFTSFVESMPVFQIITVEWSANGGTNFFDPNAAYTFSPDPSQVGVRIGATPPQGVDNTPIMIHLNNGSRFRYTTPATIGTYIISNIGLIVA